MLRNMKIGGKLFLAFGALLLLFAGVGALTWMNMNAVQRDARTLSEESVPEMVAAASVQDTAHKVLFEIRGYNYTYEAGYLTKGREHLGAIRNLLKEASDLAAKYPSLVQLREGAAKASAAVDAYTGLVDRTEQAAAGILAARRRGDDAQRAFFAAADAYLNAQNEAMEGHLNAGDGVDRIRDRLKKINLINEVIALGNGIRIANFQGQALRNPALLEEAVKTFDRIRAIIAEIRSTTVQKFNLDQLDAILKAGDQYGKVLEDIVSNWRQLDELSQTRNQAANTVLAAAEQVVRNGATNAGKIADGANANLGTTIMVILGAILFAILFGMIVAFLMTRSLVAPLKTVVALAGRASDGDLTIRREEFRISTRDELGQMADALAEMVAKQREAMRAIAASSEKLGSTAEEFAALAEESNAGVEESRAGVDDVSSQMESLAAASEEINASVEEVASGAQSSAQKGTEMAQEVEQARLAGEEGTKAVEKAVASINGVATEAERSAQQVKSLGDRAREIQSFVAQIGGIADQTNLLALNAAIEAARAGEAGRGFAVVAEEVRKLAEESNKAAKEIAALASGITKDLDSVVTSSEHGAKASKDSSRLAEETRATIGRMMEALSRISGATQDLAAVSEEQAASSEEIAGAVQNIASRVSAAATSSDLVRGQMTEVGTSAERVAQGSEELAGLAADLRKLVGAFKFEDAARTGGLVPLKDAKSASPKQKKR